MTGRASVAAHPPRASTIAFCWSFGPYFNALYMPGSLAFRFGTSLGSGVMADYQNPQQSPDAAGSTQMFRAFVDDGSTTAQPQPAAGAATTYGSASRGGSRAGVVVGVIAVLVVIAAVVYFAVA